MQIGIYKLKFNGTDKVYIGQSVNIRRRYTIHLRKLRQGTANYKMQKAYIQFGIPELEVLCECSRADLNTKELEYFNIYNSVSNGFNVASEPDIHLEGVDNGNSRYTLEQILDVFEMLLNVELSYKHIADSTGVSLSTVRHISNSESHTWLAAEFPEKYSILETLKGTARQSYANSAKAKGINYPTIISPEGIEYNIINIASFSREHDLDASAMSKILRKAPRYKSHKGWKLKE